MSSKIEIANPSDKNIWNTQYLFTFGQVGVTSVLAYASSVEEALEEAASHLLAAGYHGHITPHGDDDLGCDCDDPFECDSHTYTESGWLTSYEWSVSEPSKSDLVRLFAD